jgi:hypothetical protein
MTSAVASVCLRDVGVSFLVGFIVRVVVLVILHRLQLLPCRLFWPRGHGQMKSGELP